MSSLADEAPDVLVTVPLGAQCISFLNELANAKAANGWEPVVYMTNTCAASALILGAAGPNADGIYTSAAMGLVDVANPEVAAVEPVAAYIAEMEAQGLGDIITTGGAGWNAGEVTVAVLLDAAESPDGLTQASIINAARNLSFHPTLLREGMNYTMNGEEDALLLAGRPDRPVRRRRRLLHRHRRALLLRVDARGVAQPVVDRSVAAGGGRSLSSRPAAEVVGPADVVGRRGGAVGDRRVGGRLVPRARRRC